MKKICFYINTLQRGGAERVMSNLANQFALHDYDVTLITSYPAENEYQTNKKVKRIVLDKLRRTNPLTRNIIILFRLSREIGRIKPNSIISFMCDPNIRMLFVTFYKRSVRKVISIRNDPNMEYRNIIKRNIAKHLFKFADATVFQTKDAQNWFPKSICKKSVIIPNQVSQTFFDCDVSKCDERRNIISVGRLEEQKNQTMLIKAFAKIADKTDENLIIYGEGSLRPKLENLVSELKLNNKVFLPGNIDDVPNTIKDAKLFVLSSDFEGMPNALLEAMVLGIPCISTDCPCGGPREIIKDGFNGFLVPVGDENALAKAMLNVLALDKDKVRNVSKNAKESTEMLRPETVYHQWEKAIVG